jgi:protein phosphatase
MVGLVRERWHQAVATEIHVLDSFAPAVWAASFLGDLVMQLLDLGGASTLFGCRSDAGRVRGHNEDSLAAHRELGLWVVADGMGGAASGEVASAIVIEAIPAAVRRGASLVDAVAAAHGAVLDGVANDRGGVGMGSTVVCLRLQDGFYEVAWVGDSRAYLLEGTSLRQLSTDHSYVQALVEQGVLTPELARVNPSRHILSRVLGGIDQGDVRADMISGERRNGQRFLLCSDGLTEELTDAEIAEILTGADDPQRAADALVASALEHGGRDNVTVIVIESGPLR